MASISLRFHLTAIARHLARVEELLAEPPARADPVARRLRSQPVLRQLFDTFLAAPDRHLTRDAIARAMWNTAYDPLRHDNTLRSSIQRLPAMLRDSAEIRCERGGYQLCGWRNHWLEAPRLLDGEIDRGLRRTAGFPRSTPVVRGRDATRGGSPFARTVSW